MVEALARTPPFLRAAALLLQSVSFAAEGCLLLVLKAERLVNLGRSVRYSQAN
jgi:hypothetical protein